MSSEYALNDLLTNNELLIYRLNTSVLQEYYTTQLVPNAYIYELSDANNNAFNINLIFTEAQFCHLIGFHNFNYEGDDGWKRLQAKPKKVTNFNNYAEYSMMQFRISGFNQIHELLQSPEIYIYKAADYPQFRYKSEYFAVLVKNKRYYKLGIGLGENNIYYPETYIVDMDKPVYNFYLKPENKLKVISSKVTSTEDFFSQRLKEKIIAAYIGKFPAIKYVGIDTAKQIDLLNAKYNKVLTIQEIIEIHKKDSETYKEQNNPENQQNYKFMHGIFKGLSTAYKEFKNGSEIAAAKEQVRSDVAEPKDNANPEEN